MSTASASETMSNEPFSLTTTNEALREFLSAALILIDEARIHLEDSGLEIRGVDPANVGMIDLELSDDALEKYTPSEQEVLGLNIERLHDFLKQAGPSDTVSLVLNPQSGKLDVKVNDSLEMSMAPIDADSIRMDPDLPDIDFASTIEVPGVEFNRGIVAGDMVSDHIKIAVNNSEETFNMEAEGDTDDVEFTMDDDDYESLSVSEDASSLFSLDYLKDFKKLVGNNDLLEVRLGDEFPIKINVDKDGQEHLNITYMLAPRIESN